MNNNERKKAIWEYYKFCMDEFDGYASEEAIDAFMQENYPDKFEVYDCNSVTEDCFGYFPTMADAKNRLEDLEGRFGVGNFEIRRLEKGEVV
jgi:hypothetical protein